MPDVAGRSFELFVRALHRRAVLLHVVEGAGAGMGVGCVFAGTLLPVWWWQASDATTISIWVLIMGLIAGVVVSFVRLPGVNATLARADEQLRTRDLFTTAWAVETAGANDTDFMNVVREQAARLSRSLSPSELTLNRYGRRAWAFVGLSVLLTLTLSMLTSPPTVGASSKSLSSDPDAVLRSQVVTFQETKRGPRGSSNIKSAGPEQERLAARSTEARDVTSEAPRADSRKTDPSDTSGAGDGQATSRSPVDSPTLSGGAGQALRTHNDGPVTGGGVTSMSDSDGSTLAQAGRVRASQAPRVAPWLSADWARARADALDSVQSGRVPDAYRDVVRDYFQTDTPVQ